MRLTISILLIALLSYGVLWFLPWWTCMPVAFLITSLLPARAGRSFLAGAIGVALCWFCIIFVADWGNDHLLSRKMAILFKLPSYALLLGLNTLIGFITGGLGGWAASSLSQRFTNRNRQEIGNKAAKVSL